MIQAHIYYSGMVQGVGFRFAVRDSAVRLAVNGWVRNLSDGRVELLAEGDPDAVSQLLQAIDTQFAEYVNDRRLEYHGAEGQLKDFRIV